MLRYLFLLFITSASFAQGVRTVVIDPGHGGKDPGCVYGTIYEKDINLDVALLLGEMIKREMPDVKVVFTRTTDVKVALADRGKIANDAKADLFISIHVNATERNVNAPSGAMTLIMGKENEGSNLDMARKENDVISYEDDYTTTYKEYLSGSSEMFIIYSLMQYVNIDKSIHFGNSIQHNFKRETPLPDLGIRRQKLLVLWYTTMPGVLVELGFINNDSDRRTLTSPEGKNKMAAAILGGIREYRGEKPLLAQQKPIIEEKPIAEELAEKIAKMPVEEQSVPVSVPVSGEVFAIQILSTSRKVPQSAPEFKGVRAEENYSGGRYRYFEGRYHSRAEAEKALPKVREKFKDAFIVKL